MWIKTLTGIVLLIIAVVYIQYPGKEPSLPLRTSIPSKAQVEQATENQNRLVAPALKEDTSTQYNPVTQQHKNTETTDTLTQPSGSENPYIHEAELLPVNPDEFGNEIPIDPNIPEKIINIGEYIPVDTAAMLVAEQAYLESRKQLSTE